MSSVNWEDEGGELRIGDAERDEALHRLGDHLAAGRLTMAEYSERMEAVSAARTRAEVDRQFTDLPLPNRLVERPETTAPVTTRSDQGWGSRLVAASSGIALILFFICGFAIPGGWAWSWIWFLVPGVVRTLAGPTSPHEQGRDRLEGSHDG